jgi:N6-adenosine-specific RNA methylase IME4
MSKMSLSVHPRFHKPEKSKAEPPAVITTSLASADPAIWTDTGLALPPTLSFEDWQATGEFIGRAERSVQWWAGDWWNYGERKYGEQASQAVLLGVEPDTLSNMAAVAERIPLPRRRGNLSWGHHAEVAYLPADEADAWLDRAEAETLSVMALRKARRRARILTSGPANLPAGKYAVLLADPPWQYDFNTTDLSRAIENHYPTMTADEIACLEDAEGRAIADLPNDDAVLFLWATNPKVEEAMRVIEGWGFRYITNLVWVKDRIGMGYWARQRHELLLVATRGDMSPPPEHLRPDSVIEAPRTRHSEKPESVHEFIESIWPDVPKVEVFAREPRQGWAVFGNQVGP